MTAEPRGCHCHACPECRHLDALARGEDELARRRRAAYGEAPAPPAAPPMPPMPPHPAAGADLLDELHSKLTAYVVLPSPEAADAVVLWTAATHGAPAFSHAPRLAISSPLKRCGKSRLLDVAEAAAHDPLMTVNATVQAVFRRIGETPGDPPTIFVDEADSMFGTKRAAEGHEDLRALLNAGHQRGRPALRCVGPSHTPTEFPTFAFAALAGIGRLPDTITDRAVNITMRRRAPGETVASYRHRRDAEPLHALRERLDAWVRGSLEALESAVPEMPVEDRAADTWEPLVAVADLAGGDWPDRAREAARKLTAEAEGADVDSSLDVALLTDCRRVFDRLGAKVPSTDLVKELRGMDEAPWCEFELTARQLARRLAPYGIAPKQVKVNAKNLRRYDRSDFVDAWSRYCPPPEPPADDDGPPGSAAGRYHPLPPRSEHESAVADSGEVADESATPSPSATSNSPLTSTVADGSGSSGTSDANEHPTGRHIPEATHGDAYDRVRALALADLTGASLSAALDLIRANPDEAARLLTAGGQ